MSPYLIVLAAIFTGVLAQSNINERIVGGSVAPEGAYPYIVSIRLKGSHTCSGFIIQPNIILTAATCAYRKLPRFVTVVAGTNKLNTGGTEYAVAKIVSHENYGDMSKANDIALLKLSSPIQYTDKIAPIALATEEVDAGESATFAGWGLLSYPSPSLPNDLQHIQLPTITNVECEELHAHTAMRVYASQVCTFTKEGEGGCRGDAGGPLVVNNTAVGILSWGTPCARGLPDVFTRIPYFIDWIHENSM